MHALVLKYVEITGNWEAWIKAVEDQVVKVEHEHDEAIEREARLRDQMASQLKNKDDVLIKEHA